MLSVARSRLALIVQLSFLGLHSVGLLLGTIYTSNTPELYKNNAHNKIGWIATCMVVAQCAIGLLKLAASLGHAHEPGEEERAAFLPISVETLAHHRHAQVLRTPRPHRYSHDSGHYTASESSRSQSISSMPDQNEEQQRKLHEYEDAHAGVEADYTEKQSSLGNAKFQGVASRITAKLSKRAMRVMNAVYNAIDCISLLLGFVAILSGAVVYGGVFVSFNVFIRICLKLTFGQRGSSIFNGLAHSVKGGIFFWYGLLTLGRWMGCFADIGWAWNVKSPVEIIGRRKAAIPSAEFVESFVIFLYGASNVWLEHLAAWGSTWSAQDFEHVSISIMFFGGGLCGMLVESMRVRDLLNTTILSSSASLGSQSARQHLKPPKTYNLSMNPFPALIIFLLGLMMNSHHQSSMVSTMVHKQWGTLFAGGALARVVTYILIYLSPPTSSLPSRPPSELISSFCLISGGLIFIASNKDTVGAMERHGLHAMFPFTVTMGFTAFLMAWTIIVLAVKGWAVRRRQLSNPTGNSGA